MMSELAIKAPECLRIAGDIDPGSCFGCNQEWYGTDWQRRAGCGPTVAATLFYYLFRPGNLCFSQQEWLARMEEVWNYVTPTERGMPTMKTWSSLRWVFLGSFAMASGVQAAMRSSMICE